MLKFFSQHRLIVVLFLFLFLNLHLIAQDDPAWDNTTKTNWKNAFKVVDIPSSIDGKNQKAYMYASKSNFKKPLIVSLHTWSGDYTQKDPLTNEIIARDWNYIHPNFRGSNNNPEATGSKWVIADIEDAIAFAIKNTNTDPNEVHIVGVSGGGLATLIAFMNIKYPVKTFSAWAPISDLEAWYWESVGRKQKYANDILKSVSTDSVFNFEEAKKRSPLYQTYPIDLRKNAKLFIYEGVHDGYIGSVPITHSINIYNRLAGELIYGVSDIESINNKAEVDSNLVSKANTISLLTKRYNPNYQEKNILYDRSVYLAKKFQNIQLTIFEGGHEQIPQALGLIPIDKTIDKKCNILTLGDSNGFNKDGWVDQLKKRMPNANIINISKSGRTIGFDNNGKKELNALANIDEFLNSAQKQLKGKKCNYIILCLGTNDTKSVFAEKQNEVIVNFESLLNKIKQHSIYHKSKTKLIFVTPPPMRTKNILDKYIGGNERLQVLVPQLMKIAAQYKFEVIDIYNPLLGIIDYYAQDGIHMSGGGQDIIAGKIIDKISKQLQ
ncbi:G-D-S-L family lipolytic protein [Flavobacterium sp. L1I52]|uniref:G-D-S-L family lipolytic protein n=1 Tax=Flavobacterium pokkalii TaxID=1940408 RepID=A0ABR7UV78_9FLAO|nr:GDSL-type esterase/lipase family protein [Flavobacterium pokkalii]MBD0725840.1 G-D-S-L family lipolytic protein [Flavobacterium pokkalii]